MSVIKFNSQTVFKKAIRLNGIEYNHFDLNSIPKKFGCINTSTGGEGISSYINYKGITYFTK